MNRILLAAAAVTLTAGGALAADISPIVIPPPPVPVVVPAPHAGNLYISAFAGLALTRGAVWEQPEPEFEARLRGFRLAGAVGMNIGGGPLSVEGDVTWARLSLTDICNPVDPSECEGLDEGDLEGLDTHADLLTLMGNVRIGKNSGFLRPYVAVGGGVARLAVFSNFDDGVGPGDVDNTDWTWGFQAIVGVDLAITENLSIGARYRYQRIGATAFVDGAGDDFTVTPFSVHSIEGGITIHFGG